MVFCRGCGQSIHETAPSCPHCGALQATGSPAVAEPEGSLWLPVPALVLGVFGVLGVIGVATDAEQKGFLDKDAATGVAMFAVTGLVLGLIGAIRQARGRGMSISAVVLSCLGLLAAIGLLLGL